MDKKRPKAPKQIDTTQIDTTNQYDTIDNIIEDSANNQRRDQQSLPPPEEAAEHTSPEESPDQGVSELAVGVLRGESRSKIGDALVNRVVDALLHYDNGLLQELSTALARNRHLEAENGELRAEKKKDAATIREREATIEELDKEIAMLRQQMACQPDMQPHAIAGAGTELSGLASHPTHDETIRYSHPSAEDLFHSDISSSIKDALSQLLLVQTSNISQAQQILRALSHEIMNEPFTRSLVSVFKVKKWGVMCPKCDTEGRLCWTPDARLTLHGKAQCGHRNATGTIKHSAFTSTLGIQLMPLSQNVEQGSNKG